MMTENERAFLAYMALGWFSVDRKGQIWRHYQYKGGGIRSQKKLEAPIRAERGASARDGYLRVMFTTETGQRRQVAAHRIVWMVHNSSPIPKGFELNHKDGIKQNNHPVNLELVTRSENTLHAIYTLGKIHPAPRAMPGAKLTEEQVYQIRNLWKERAMSQPEMAKRFGVSVVSIQGVIYRRTWKHLPELI